MIQELFKLTNRGLKVLFKFLFFKKQATITQTDLGDNNPKIRIQFEDFTLDNFDTAPVWEFALDEEGEDGQDETTLRPCFGLTVADPAEGLCIVKAEFETSAGKKHFGLCSPAFEFKFDDIQPYMVTDNGTISFWSGMLEPSRQFIDELYKQLGESKDTLFPIKFNSVIPSKGAKLKGQIDGFMWRPIDGEKIITVK